MLCLELPWLSLLDFLTIMSGSSTSQQISLEILRDPSRACLTKHLDVLELEDASLSQLHPLARVIALAERGRTSSVHKEMLQQATKTIALSGVHEICKEEDSDDWDLTYYKITKLRRRQCLLNCFTESVYQKDIKVEFQLGCEMNGGSMDGFTSANSRVSMSVEDLPLVANLINDYGKEKKWIDRFLSAKAKALSSLDPGFDNLDGCVAIYLEGISFRMDDHVFKLLDLPNIPVADFQYSVGELTENCIHVPIDVPSEIGARCFWPMWLPVAADELTIQLETYYRDHLSSETDPGVIEQIHHAAASIGEWCRLFQYGGLYIDLEELIYMENFTAPQFRDVCFNISSKKLLPPYFKASEHIGLDGLAEHLLKMRDIGASMTASIT